MEGYVFIGIAIIAYIFYKAVKKNGGEERIGQLETRANYFLKKVIDSRKNELEELKKESKELFHKDLIESNEQSIKSLMEWELKYIAIKEKYKHEPLTERVAIAQDWDELMESQFQSQLDLEHHHEFIDYYAGSTKEEREEENRENQKERVRVKEIMKRLDGKLKD